MFTKEEISKQEDYINALMYQKEQLQEAFYVAEGSFREVSRKLTQERILLEAMLRTS